MAGYTPVFDSVFKGSLYGKWPDTAAWICMLALADWQGHVDIMPEAIAGMTGMPIAELLGCIERFCAPDPRSRSQAEEGRKLVLIDPARDWGWRVVNIQLYRDKASGHDQVRDGRNAAKVKRYKERHQRTPLDTGGHHKTPPDTYSDSNTDSDKEKDVGTSSLCSETTRQSSSFFSEPDGFKKPVEEKTRPIRELAKTLAQSKRVPR